MYFVDFAYYFVHKKSISGSCYYNCEYGPVPATNQKNYHQNNLLLKGQQQNLWQLDNTTIVLNIEKAIELDGFNLAQTDTIDEIVGQYGRLNSFDLVTLTHQDMPWKMTKNGETIDYEYVFWRETQEAQVENITSHLI